MYSVNPKASASKSQNVASEIHLEPNVYISPIL